MKAVNKAGFKSPLTYHVKESLGVSTIHEENNSEKILLWVQKGAPLPYFSPPWYRNMYAVSVRARIEIRSRYQAMPFDTH